MKTYKIYMQSVVTLFLLLVVSGCSDKIHHPVVLKSKTNDLTIKYTQQIEKKRPPTSKKVKSSAPNIPPVINEIPSAKSNTQSKMKKINKSELDLAPEVKKVQNNEVNQSWR